MKGRFIAATLAVVIAAAAAPLYAQSNEELLNDGRNTDNVLTYGMGYQQQRYSTLDPLNKGTVRRLTPVWAVSLGSNYGEQAQPLVYNGVLYATDAEATTAIDIDSDDNPDTIRKRLREARGVVAARRSKVARPS